MKWSLEHLLRWVWRLQKEKIFIHYQKQSVHSTILALTMVAIFMDLVPLVDAIEQLVHRLPQYGTTQILMRQLIANRHTHASKKVRPMLPMYRNRTVKRMRQLKVKLLRQLVPHHTLLDVLNQIQMVTICITMKTTVFYAEYYLSLIHI